MAPQGFRMLLSASAGPSEADWQSYLFGLQASSGCLAMLPVTASLF